jgi:hypothetical protein
MKQKRICEYFRLRCTHFRTVLYLPFDVRHRIYKLAGLIVGSEIYLSSCLSSRDHTQEPDGFGNFTLCILQVCKAVYNESMVLRLSQNTLIVPQESTQYGLRFLRQLAPHHCRHITDLYVCPHCPTQKEERRLLQGTYSKESRHLAIC